MDPTEHIRRKTITPPCDYFPANARPRPRGNKRWLLAWTCSLVSLVGLLALWSRSYRTEDELRWMSGGTHRHLESADGTFTFVSTAGYSSTEYFSWASSGDLSYGRALDWYASNLPGQPRWYVRIPYAVPAGIAASLLAVSTLKLRRGLGRAMPTHPGGQEAILM